MRWLAAALILSTSVGVARADIRIDESRYSNGNLIITGETAPNSTVTLDGKYKVKSDGGGFFKFTEHYRPFTCMSDIRVGTDIYSAVIAGCLDPGLGDDKLPVNKTAAKPAH